ncbi:MAG: hypothetical protein ACOYD0_12065 [Candidatus Nanopelagicales bacterium]
MAGLWDAATAQAEAATSTEHPKGERSLLSSLLEAQFVIDLPNFYDQSPDVAQGGPEFAEGAVVAGRLGLEVGPRLGYQ